MPESGTVRHLAFTGDYLWPTQDQLLLLHAALDDGDRARTAFRTWRNSVDIDAPFSPGAFRLLPMVYDNLSRLGETDPLMGRLKGAFRRSWVETQKFFNSVAPVVEEANGRGIPMMVLKGAPLSIAYYQRAGLRPMADLDLVVHAEHVPAAVGVLESLGWKPALSLQQQAGFGHALQFSNGAGAFIDLHWHPLFDAQTSRATREFWRDSEPLAFHGVTVRQPGPTHALVQTVAHGVRANLEPPIRWIMDAMIIIRRRGPEIDWDGLEAFARRERLASRVGLGLRYLVMHFQAAVPARIIDRLAAEPLSIVERVENSVVLAPPGQWLGLARTQWRFFADYCRAHGTPDPLRFVLRYPAYVALRWDLAQTRDLPGFVARGLWRKLRRSFHEERAHS